MAPKPTCLCGTCAKCKHREYMNDYYRRNPEKIRAIATASRNRRLATVRAYDRARGHRIYDLAKERARRKTYHAIAKGHLQKQPCEVCGAIKVEAHHDDYEKPYEVRWRCRTHHMALHRSVAA
jgi:hypothetical protein